MVGLPLAKNGLVVVIIVNFVTAWGEYLLCATLSNDQLVRTMPVVLASAHGGMGQWAWPRMQQSISSWYSQESSLLLSPSVCFSKD